MADPCIMRAEMSSVNSGRGSAIPCTMPVTHEEVHQQITDSIGNIQEGHLIEKCSVANGVKRLTKV